DKNFERGLFYATRDRARRIFANGSHKTGTKLCEKEYSVFKSSAAGCDRRLRKERDFAGLCPTGVLRCPRESASRCRFQDRSRVLRARRRDCKNRRIYKGIRLHPKARRN